MCFAIELVLTEPNGDGGCSGAVAHETTGVDQMYFSLAPPRSSHIHVSDIMATASNCPPKKLETRKTTSTNIRIRRAAMALLLPTLTST